MARKLATESGASGFVTVEDLRNGRRARISSREFSVLSGLSLHTLERDRWQKQGVPFRKDGKGRVWYAAEDVLACIESPKHLSTCEYDTSKNLAALSVAREKISKDTTRGANNRG